MHEPHSSPNDPTFPAVPSASVPAAHGVAVSSEENGVAPASSPFAPSSADFGAQPPVQSAPSPVQDAQPVPDSAPMVAGTISSVPSATPAMSSGAVEYPVAAEVTPVPDPASVYAPYAYNPAAAPVNVAVPISAAALVAGPYGVTPYAAPVAPYQPTTALPASEPPLSAARATPLPARSPLLVSEPIAAQPPRASAMNPVLALLVGGLLSCALFGMGMGLQRRMDGSTPSAQAQSAGGALPIVNDKSGNAIINAVRAVGPAVMNVDTTFGKGQQSAEFLPEPGGDSNTPRRGKGTGVVIDSKRGLMLTNAHVVAGAQDIQVTTRDGKIYRGKVLGADRYNDIAVVKLNTDKLSAAHLASFKDPKELSIGQWTIAIGNPYAQANSVTVGVLSAVGRDIPVPGPDGEPQFKLSNMMQTDAAINPGNSGGPLCNINGEVIGINTAIIPFATGLGFTIPISKAKSVADMLIANNGQIPYIGIEMTPVTDALKQEFGLSDTRGALVKSVAPNSPAAQAGVQPGDVLRMVDGKGIIGGEDIQAVVRTKKIGSAMSMTIVRNSSTTKTVTLKIGPRPGQ